ncbi:MAG: hypothetical protein MI742_14835 [Desulfobacterales bacterium]|nr:hypothetical protein [Desulfobacterales bacterium]
MGFEAKAAGPAVKIKGYGDGFLLWVDPGSSEEQVTKLSMRIFRQLRNLATGALVQVDTGSWETSCLWADRLAPLLEERFSVSGVLPFGEPPDSGGDSCEVEGTGLLDPDTRVLTGRVRSGQRIMAERHLLILGDVNPGGEVVAGGDIYVMGSLRGMARAGSPSDKSSIVMALDFRPMQLEIGSVSGRVTTTGDTPSFVQLQGEELRVADYLKENPFAKQPVLKWRV